jgi:hypothetical protein
MTVSNTMPCQQLFGYDQVSLQCLLMVVYTRLTAHQGVVSNVLAIESFGAKFPAIYTNATLKVRVIFQSLLCLSELHYF